MFFHPQTRIFATQNNKSMKRFLEKWDTARWLRLLLGAGFAAYGFYHNEGYAIAFGLLLTLMSLLNWSCCAAGSCNATSGKGAPYKNFVKPYNPKNE